ncbi:MAG: DUF4173 domain-containing protein [Agathobacter sp.]|nr:DUF4173 domain-containing protein [Agathobacter sp.]
MDERVMDINLHNENHVYNENNTYNVNKTCNEQGDYNFQKIIGATLIYAIFFTFCIYKNFAGITAPFLAAATVGYAIFCLKEYKINIKKDSIFYMAAIILLGVSSCITGSGPIIFFNTIGMGFLLLCMMLHNFYNDEKWNFAKYMGAIFMSFFGVCCELPAPYKDIKRCDSDGSRSNKAMYVIIGLAVAFPLLCVIIALLYSADAVFAQVIENCFSEINFGTIIGCVFTFAFAFFASYCGVRYLNRKKIKEEVHDHREMEPIIAMTVLSLILMVYLVFSVIQIVYLFMGQMQLPDGYTYARYVHEGFFQLLLVCMLNVMIVLGVMAIFRKNTVVNILLAMISFCTYIMLASSALRMCMYIKNYSLTFLRVLVLWSLAVIAILLGGILIQIFKEDFSLFRYGLISVCICYILLSYSHVDYFIASFNLNYVAENEGRVDYYYLSELSSDAAPVIADYEGDWVYEYSRGMQEYEDDGVRKFNLSHYIAVKTFE